MKETVINGNIIYLKDGGIYHTDCFAYKNINNRFKCNALRVENCLDCSFYRSKKKRGAEYDY